MRSIGSSGMAGAARQAHANLVASQGRQWTVTLSRSSFTTSAKRFDEDRSSKDDSQDPSASSSAPASSSPSSSISSTPSKPTYQPPSLHRGAWPFDSSDSSASSDSQNSPADDNPYADLLSGDNPFPTVDSPNRSSVSWLSHKLDSLASPSAAPSSDASRNRRSTRPQAAWDGGKQRRGPGSGSSGKNLVPRSVLFADSNAMTPEELRVRSSHRRKRYDRTPLTQQEANAFMSLLNQALSGSPSESGAASASSSPSSSSLLDSSSDSLRRDQNDPNAEEEKPFGAYTSFISNPRTEQGGRNLLQAFANRNRLARFEESRRAREKRFVREGLAAQISHAELEAGIDEARECISMCENLAEVVEFARKDVWGLLPSRPATATASSNTTTKVQQSEEVTQSSQTEEQAVDSTAEQSAAAVPAEEKPPGPRFGRQTPFYAPVLHLLFVTIRDRYRSPWVALTIPKVTKNLGVESYVLGMTSNLTNEVIKTQWDFLGDLTGVLSTLQQARDIGILSSSSAFSSTGRGGRDGPSDADVSTSTTLGSAGEDTIRGTVDRIINEVRKHVLEQNTRASAGVFGGSSSTTSTDWYSQALLSQTHQASKLAGYTPRPRPSSYSSRDRR
ncbi:hypothetical protein BCV70DRAFT_200558 [Testicularia cyperi]|uniref:Mtf2-like C-terminal domain-containing protein n=1 Tax=Testicularia cyperi TaxID=1882483 RepID=A0A317XMS4_9BASI|nr:hypothetical protein BCV70DRAFT_200558 [Testicularia cyperi]